MTHGGFAGFVVSESVAAGWVARGASHSWWGFLVAVVAALVVGMIVAVKVGGGASAS